MSEQKLLLKLSDPDFRVRNLYKIVNKNGEWVQFVPNVLQEEINKMRAKFKRMMILKSRQIGFSTNEIVSMTDEAAFSKNQTTLILAHEQDSIKKLFRIVQRTYKSMPDQLKPRLDRGGGSKYEYYFPEINSRIYCDLESRSDTIQRLHISECAFMKDSAKLKATLQTVPINGRVTIETTANGMANFFYDMWNDKDSIYRKFFFPWFLFPDYKMDAPLKMVLTDEEKDFIKKAKKLFNHSISKEQLAFRRFKKQELKRSSHDQTLVTFEQEYPEDDKTCFLASGDPVMDLFEIDKQLTESPDPISDDKGFAILDQHDGRFEYVCGADPAEGITRDFSAAVMIKVRTKQVVARIRGQWKPSDFADKLFELCKLYSSHKFGMPRLAVERNNHGHAVLLKLDEILRYPNIFVDLRDERMGWKTDNVTRPVMIDNFIDAAETRLLKVLDREILGECLTLIDNNGKIEAAEGKHDDCIIACAIAFQLALAASSSVYENLESRILV